MVNLGQTLEEIVSSHGYLPSDVRWVSTDFQRTLESLLGVRAGFEGESGLEEIEVDATRTNELIPDPQPRLTEKQAELERDIVNSEDFKAWDGEHEADRLRLSEVLSVSFAILGINQTFTSPSNPPSPPPSLFSPPPPPQYPSVSVRSQSPLPPVSSGPSYPRF